MKLEFQVFPGHQDRKTNSSIRYLGEFLFRDLLTFRNSQLTKDLRYQARGNIKISVKRRMSYLKEAEPILIIVLKRTQAFPELAPCFGFPEAPLCLLSWS